MCRDRDDTGDKAKEGYVSVVVVAVVRTWMETSEIEPSKVVVAVVRVW